ncbi:hypothetical protein CQW23_30985 [Capsicum baccatum]|uniref:Glycosyl hydrolase family 32 C-terminal domain-containing protein n=1 Tax=Capsicum baccatum TaxID=33114 RepID=A0A2G2V8T7_CAPBA|nr:hypothetical protein CQW23_30985 [Capsicum baccatum]
MKLIYSGKKEKKWVGVFQKRNHGKSIKGRPINPPIPLKSPILLILFLFGLGQMKSDAKFQPYSQCFQERFLKVRSGTRFFIKVQEGGQGIPRRIWLEKSGNQLLQWPIVEIEKLRINPVVEDNTALMPGSVREISGVDATQADVEMSFSAKTLEDAEKWEGNWTNPQQVCSIIGASVKGLPHTCLLVIMTKPLCGTFLNVDPLQEKLSLRTLIDHSIVESFGGEGKACITARVYPTNSAVDGATHLYFFNNGSQSIHISKFTAWTMKSAQIN